MVWKGVSFYKLLSQNSTRICHLGVIRNILHDQIWLIFLDNVNNLKQFDAVAHEMSWFGSGSMVIKPTEYKKLVEHHGFKSICYVDFPSREEALKILCGFDF